VSRIEYVYVQSSYDLGSMSTPSTDATVQALIDDPGRRYRLGGGGRVGRVPLVAAAIDGEAAHLHGRQDGQHPAGAEDADEPRDQPNAPARPPVRDRLPCPLELPRPDLRLLGRLHSQVAEPGGGAPVLGGFEASDEV